MSDSSSHRLRGSEWKHKLPDGWCWVSVFELLTEKLCNGISIKGTDTPPGTPALKLGAMGESGFDYTDRRYIPIEGGVVAALAIREGDFFVARGNGSLRLVGRGTLAQSPPGDIVFPDTMIRMRLPEAGSLRKYVAVLWQSSVIRRQVAARARTTAGIYKISQQDIEEFQLPIAPLEEQHRIVAKVEELFSDLDAAVAALERVRVKLKRYRASVLKAAIGGKLTEEWRTGHRRSEPATALLDCILKERRCRWEEAQRVKFAEAKTEPPEDWRAKYQEPPGSDTSALRTLPLGWCWAKVNQVGEVRLGRQRSPQHHQGPHMRPYLRVANVFEDRIDTIDVLQMNFTPEEYEVYRLEVGDILLNEGQSLELVGRPAMYRGEVPGSCFQNTLVRFRAYTGLVPEYALYVFLAYLHNKRFQKLARWTVNIAHLGADRFSQVEFPLPPADEQREIVREIESRLSVIRQLGVQVEANLKRAARLRQSILKRAFEGKLVPQVQTDEPASVLIDRIREHRQATVDPAARGETRKPSKGRREPNEVFFRRMAVVTYIVRRLSNDPSFGRTKLEKVLHLTQTHLPYPLGLEFKRYAAGPFDEVIFKDEAVAKKRGWFETRDRPSFGVTYHPGPNAADLCQRASGYLADKQPSLDALLDHLAKLTTDDAELLATLYAAWNDLLIDGRPADEEALIAEVYGWDESKRKFSRKDILNRIAWMRQHGYVPTGKGQRTTVLEKKVKLPSSRKKQSR